MEPIIDVKDIELSYNQYSSLTFAKKRSRKEVLKGLSFKLQKGEILGLVGRNGCGKSSTLSLLAKIISPDAGTITYNDCKNVSLLNFSTGMLPHLSGVDNIYVQGYYLGLTHKEIKSRINDIIALSEIRDSLHNPVGTYSSGMKARLGFSVAYYSKSEVLLIDETLGVGDYIFKEKSTRMMKEKIRNNSAAIIVTHDETLLKEMCSRCIVLHEGKARFTGGVEESLEFYKSKDFQ